MIERLLIEKETIYVSLDTGEVVDTHAEALGLYGEGHTVQIQYRYRYNGGDWEGWNDGPQWIH